MDLRKRLFTREGLLEIVRGLNIETKKREDEKIKDPFQVHTTHLCSTWNNLALFPRGKRPYVNRHHFQHGLGALRNCTFGYCLSHKTRSKD